MPARWPRPLTPNRRRALACEIEEELRTHLTLRADDNRRAGMDPTEAEADALTRFGDVEHIAAACLSARGRPPPAARGTATRRDRARLRGRVRGVRRCVLTRLRRLRPPAPLRRGRPARPVRCRVGGCARPARHSSRRGRRRATSFERLTAFSAMDFALGGGVARRTGCRLCSSATTTSPSSASHRTCGRTLQETMGAKKCSSATGSGSDGSSGAARHSARRLTSTGNRTPSSG